MPYCPITIFNSYCYYLHCFTVLCTKLWNGVHSFFAKKFGFFCFFFGYMHSGYLLFLLKFESLLLVSSLYWKFFLEGWLDKYIHHSWNLEFFYPLAVYKFDASLSNEERALVHQVAQKMGFKSKSSGWVLRAAHTKLSF